MKAPVPGLERPRDVLEVIKRNLPFGRSASLLGNSFFLEVLKLRPQSVELVDPRALLVVIIKPLAVEAAAER